MSHRCCHVSSTFSWCWWDGFFVLYTRRFSRWFHKKKREVLVPFRFVLSVNNVLYTSYLNFKYLPFLAFKAKRSIRITNGQLHVTISSEWPLKTFSSQSWVVRFCKGLWSLDQIQESIRIHSKWSRYKKILQTWPYRKT